MQPNQKVQGEADKGIKTRNAGECGKGNTKRGAESEEDWRMDSAQHCYDQAAECRRLMKTAQSNDEAQLLANISQSWLRVAGQIDRYHAIMREQGRIVRK